MDGSIGQDMQPKLTARTTRHIMREALATVVGADLQTNVMTDGGSENLTLAEMSEFKHVSAQVDITESNSMVEALWSQIRHRWLYLHSLDSFEALNRLVAKYFTDHNAFIPRAELGGRTPDEAFLELESDLPDRLREQHAHARAQGILKNRARSCGACRPHGPVPGIAM